MKCNYQTAQLSIKRISNTVDVSYLAQTEDSRALYCLYNNLGNNYTVSQCFFSHRYVTAGNQIVNE